jgi:hypothetical protein
MSDAKSIDYQRIASQDDPDVWMDALSRRTEAVVRVAGENREELMRRMRDKRVLDPTILETNEPFFWQALISSDKLDSHGTRMSPQNTLPNFARDAQDAGVAFLQGHHHWLRPTGRSLTGAFLPDSNQVIAQFYTLRGLNLNGTLPTDQFIDGVRSGIISDVSVGFKRLAGFRYTCSICGEDIWRSPDCPHVPMVSYPIGSDSSGSQNPQLCFAWVENAGLSEVSDVYDGSNADAMILKATRLALNGQISLEVAHVVEATRQIHLPGRTVRLAFNTRGSGNKVMETITENQAGAALLPTARIRDCLNQLGLECAPSVANDAEAMLRLLVEKIEMLKPLADEGTQLKADLIESVIAEGTRAFGQDKYDAEKQRRALATLTVSDLKAQRDSFKETADAFFATNVGRKSIDICDEDVLRPKKRSEHTEEGEVKGRDASPIFDDDDPFSAFNIAGVAGA